MNTRLLARHGLRCLLLAALLSSGCKPYFVLPGTPTPKPTDPPATAITVACDTPPQRLLIPKEVNVRWFGPMKVRVIEAKEKKEHQLSNAECLPPVPCQLSVPANALMEVSIGRLEKATHEWGMLCFCDDDDCTPDCIEGESRIDVRVTCPETRFALREKYGIVSAPLPAHLPLDITCRPSRDDPEALDCKPTLVSLDKAQLVVSGALRLSKGERVEPNEVLVFSPSPDARGLDQDASLCLHAACSNPTYFLPLRVDFEDMPMTSISSGILPISLVPQALRERFSSACQP